MSFAILTDGGCNLNQDQIDAYGIKAAPLSILVDGIEYPESFGSDEEIKRFYGLLREEQLATTSAVNPAVVEGLAREVLERGEDLLYIAFSSALSASNEVAFKTLEGLKASYPDRIIHCIDSLSASGGQGLLVRYAATMREEGKTIDEVAQWILDNRLHLCHWFTVDDLMFLHRGGRVSKASAIAGTVLGIKPVLHVDDEGRLILVEKAKSRRKSLLALLEHMETTAIAPVADQTVFISHGDCLEDAEFVAERIRERFGVDDIVISYVSPAIGTHSGPGTVALFFLGDKR
ncbi:MAG: DegV family protein [Actinobacteria bacterium]|nr:DegV family protein [Actinomycetota bacterium]